MFSLAAFAIFKLQTKKKIDRDSEEKDQSRTAILTGKKDHKLTQAIID
jgi:hypothetical protein